MLNFQKKIINNYFRFSKINIIHLIRNALNNFNNISELRSTKKAQFAQTGLFYGLFTFHAYLLINVPRVLLAFFNNRILAKFYLLN